MKNGYSVLEVILAMAIFMIFSTGAISVITQGYNSDRLGTENTVAAQFAAEGIEAARSIRNQSFSNLEAVNNQPRGLIRNANSVWALNPTDGSSDTLVHNSSDNYVRQVTVEPVYRDTVLPIGNIVPSGGVLDRNTKKITSTVKWNFNSARPQTTSLTTYLTGWRKYLDDGSAVGVAIYGDSTSITQPKYRIFSDNSNSYTAEAITGISPNDTVVGKNFKVRTSPIRHEAVAGYVNNNGVLRMLCFDGEQWTSEWTQSVGGTGTNDQRFGIAYERTSGDALVVYSNNGASGSNELSYRTKPGTAGCGSAAWSSPTTISTSRTSGTVHWISMESKLSTGSNDIAIAWADSNSDLSAMIWTGASFGVGEPPAALETNLERVSTSQDSLSFDVAFETASGNLMIAWGLYQAAGCNAGTTINNNNCIRYARYTGTWSAVGVIPTVSSPATNLDLSANPNTVSPTNEVVLGAINDHNQGNLSAAYWSGSAWTGVANLDNSTTLAIAGSKLVATGWLISGSTTRSVIVYSDFQGSSVDWVMGNGAAFTVQSDCTSACNPAIPTKYWFDIQLDPINKDRLLLFISGSGHELTSKRALMNSGASVTWAEANNALLLTSNLSQSTSSPFSFDYWRNYER